MTKSRVLSGREMGTKMLSIMGIPLDRVTGLTISMNADDVAVVTVTRSITADEAEGLTEEIKRYTMVEAEE